MKNQGIYGAEIRVEGFSGYLCELLITHYDSFINLVKEAAKWEIPTIIDVESYHPKKDLTKVFTKAPMIVIDPVDKSRNVAAVVSSTSLSIFIFACRQFLKSQIYSSSLKRKRKLARKN